MGRVQDKVVIVTGGAKGLGRADAEQLAAAGARVVIADIDEDAGQRTAAEVAGTEFRRHDVTDEAAWQSLVADVVARHGRLDGLVNNAGIIRVGDPCTHSIPDLRAMMAVNVEGTVLGCKHAIPAMIEAGGGSIVNIASIGAVSGLYFYAGYCATKGAIAAYSRAVAVYCAQNRLNIRCNTLLPGGVDTPLNQQLAVELQAAMAGMRLPPDAPVREDAPQMRYARPEDMAHAVVYLISDESRFMNGAEMRIDNSATITAAVVP